MIGDMKLPVFCCVTCGNVTGSLLLVLVLNRKMLW